MKAQKGARGKTDVKKTGREREKTGKVRENGIESLRKSDVLLTQPRKD